MVEMIVTSADLVAAFRRTRAHWKRLYEGAPEQDAEREGILHEVETDLAMIAAAARISEEARPYIVTAFRIRLGAWRASGAELAMDLAEAADGVRAGFEMRLRTLRQMESGDEVLPDAGRDVRRSAARDVCFFHRLRKLLAGEAIANGDRSGLKDVDLARLSQCFDPRRKMVRDELDVPGAAIEAVEFLVRLGASG